MSFSDVGFAARFRDLMTQIAAEVARKVHPPPAYATVIGIDRAAYRCTVLFPSSDTPVTIGMGSVQPAEVGVKVRVCPVNGDMFLEDVLGPAILSELSFITDDEEIPPDLPEEEFVEEDVRVAELLVTDPSGDELTTGDGQMYFLIPTELGGWVIQDVHGAVTTASSSGSVVVQVARNRSGVVVDTLSTSVTIEANEASSYTSATPAVVNTDNDDVAEGDFLRIDIDSAGTGAKGLIIVITFQQVDDETSED